jgi:hypothetical protein
VIRVDGANEAGSSNGLPWSSVFDPIANMHAFSAVQADGFRAASELVERFVRIASATLDQNAGLTARATPASDEQGADLFGATGLEPLVTSWWSMADQFFRPPVRRGAQQGAPAAFDLSADDSVGQLALEAGAGSTAAVEVWLHNHGPLDMGKVQLRCSDLLAHDGAVIPAHVLRFEPDVVPMPARCSRGVTVEIHVADDLAPGHYRGTLLADGHDELWLPVILTIPTSVP